MKARVLAALALAGTLSGCATDSRPGNVENACAIFEDRPHWQQAVAASEARWGAPANVQLAIIWKESSFRPDAKPSREYALGFIPWGRRSSAYGFGQAIDGTWEWYQRETGNWSADRDDFEDAADFVGWYMARSARVNGIPMEDAYNHYLAYHEGHAGWRRGSWREKAWLQRVAGQVRRKATEYGLHMDSCGV